MVKGWKSNDGVAEVGLGFKRSEWTMYYNGKAHSSMWDNILLRSFKKSKTQFKLKNKTLNGKTDLYA